MINSARDCPKGAEYSHINMKKYLGHKANSLPYVYEKVFTSKGKMAGLSQNRYFLTFNRPLICQAGLTPVYAADGYS